MKRWDGHALEVEKICQEVKNLYRAGEQAKIFHGSTNSTRAQNLWSGKYVDVSQLNGILEINKADKYIWVEPNVAMDQLVEATLAEGLIPPVVMEFPGITVGGGIQGGAGESSSFKYGLFHNQCIEYEMVLGNGKLVTASPTKNSDLFFGTAGAYGSLGIITLVKLRLIKAQDYVKLTYHLVNNFQQLVAETKRLTAENDFVDAIMFSKTSGVVMTGILSSVKTEPFATFSKADDEWFYLHAQKVSREQKDYTEFIPITDYLFRYDRGGFWVAQHTFTYFKIPFNKFTRWLFSRFFTTRTLYRFLHATNYSQQYFVQDLCLPQEYTKSFLDYVDHHLAIYPLWLLPIKSDARAKFVPNYLATNLVLDVGVWGETNPDYAAFVNTNREVEAKVQQLGGRKLLYAHSYYKESEFWQIYDQNWYKHLRQKYFADRVFPDIYAKTRVVERYRSTVGRGIWKVITGRD